MWWSVEAGAQRLEAVLLSWPGRGLRPRGGVLGQVGKGSQAETWNFWGTAEESAVGGPHMPQRVRLIVHCKKNKS